MIDQEIESLLKASMPDAVVAVSDMRGGDHLDLRVVSEFFKGKDLLDRHRAVYELLKAPMADGRIHALQIKALTPQELMGKGG
jgi:stress-induced morphogen